MRLLAERHDWKKSQENEMSDELTDGRISREQFEVWHEKWLDAAVLCQDLYEQRRLYKDIAGAAWSAAWNRRATLPQAQEGMPKRPASIERDDLHPDAIVVMLADYDLLRAYAAKREEDAERYRWLRSERISLGDGLPFIGVQGSAGFTGFTGENADYVIDAARKPAGREG